MIDVQLSLAGRLAVVYSLERSLRQGDPTHSSNSLVDHESKGIEHVTLTSGVWEQNSLELQSLLEGDSELSNYSRDDDGDLKIGGVSSVLLLVEHHALLFDWGNIDDKSLCQTEGSLSLGCFFL